MPETRGKNRVLRSGDTMTGDLNFSQATAQLGSTGTTTLVLAASSAVSLRVNGTTRLTINTTTGGTTFSAVNLAGVFLPVQAPTSTLPAFVAGGFLWDSTIKRMRSGDSVAFNPVQTCIYATVSPGANISIDPTLGDVFAWTPGETEAITAASQIAGHRISIVLHTSGVTSYTLTFGSGFITAGTLASGTVTAKTFVINFISDGTNYIETGRTGAM